MTKEEAREAVQVSIKAQSGIGIALIAKYDFKDLPYYMVTIGPGWVPLVEEAFDKMIALGWNKKLSQVKEKFGGLRIYVHGASDAVHDVITEAEKKAWVTCEDCGKEAQPDPDPNHFRWLRTLCLECRIAWNNRK